MEIKRSEVMERVGAESVSSHYFSAPGTGKRSEEVKRVPLLSECRYAIVTQWADEAMERVLARLSGWSGSVTIEHGILKVDLARRYATRESMVRSTALEMMAADVWRRVVAQQFPEIRAEARKRFESAEDRMMSVLCV